MSIELSECDMNSWEYLASGEDIENLCSAAIDTGIVSRDDRSVVFHDLDLLRARIKDLIAIFPGNALHAIAIKANPVIEVLKVSVEAGAGLEAASFEEVQIGLAAGCPPSRLVFDSPAKAIDELAEALELGVMVNVDNFTELERINDLLAGRSPVNKIGLRINPVVGSGSIGITSVADKSSKFGLRLDRDREAIIEAFRCFSWLTGLHVHIGSQGCDLDLLIAGVRRVQELRGAIERALGVGRIGFVDIGGGLPTRYLEEDKPPTLSEYVHQLKLGVPELFEDRIQLITEFGRAIQAGCGIALTRVEYVKTLDDLPLAVVHLGADMLMRPVYLPEQWKHRFFALDSKGRLKNGPELPWSIAGPLCFAGDILSHRCLLPALEAGDYVAIGDVGAYTVSLWSRHCSRGIPLMVGYIGEAPDFVVLRERETASDIVRYWGREGI